MRNSKRFLIILLSIILSLTSLFGCTEESRKDIQSVTRELAQDTKEALRDIGKIGKKVAGELGDLTKNNSHVNTRIDDPDDYVFTDYYALNGFAEIVYDVPAVGNIVYGKLDKYNRPTYVIGNLSYETVKQARARGRQPINVDPAGWPQNKKVEIKEKDGKTYHGYFYNRSHMLADSLGGDPIKENLVTGTRTQNVGIKNQGGMAYTEIQARDFFVVPTEETLIYQVRPVYNSDEPIPRYVIVDVKSSNGKIDEQVIVDNSANGYKINYNTGEFKKISN